MNLEQCYVRYQTNEKINTLFVSVNPDIKNILFNFKFLMDSYDDYVMLKKLLKVKLGSNTIIDEYINLFKQEKIPKTDTDIKVVFNNGIANYKNTKFEVSAEDYEIYSKYADDSEILKIVMYYSDRIVNGCKKNDLLEKILNDIKPKNITQICSCVIDANLYLKNTFKNINFNMHTFNVKLNEPFFADDFYISDNFRDNSIIYISDAVDFYLFNVLLNHTIPSALKKYKNICFISVQSAADKTIVSIIKDNVNKNDYYESKNQLISFLKYSGDFPLDKLNNIKKYLDKDI